MVYELGLGCMVRLQLGFGPGQMSSIAVFGSGEEFGADVRGKLHLSYIRCGQRLLSNTGLCVVMDTRWQRRSLSPEFLAD